MGNKNGSEFGGIIVRTEKLLYISGEVVKGVIYLNLKKPDFQGKILLFQIVGKESNKWSKSSGDRRRIYKAKSKFYDRSVVVHEFNDQNLLGQFAFPFEVQLPFNLPGSFMYVDKITALITYKFKAKFISTNKSINPIKHKQEVTIREPALMQLQVQITQNQGNLQTWCCVDQGTTQIWAKTDKNYYSPREYVKFQYDIDNTQCKLDISRIEINFLNKLELTHKNDIKRILYLKKNVIIHEGLKSQSRIQMDQQRVGEIQMIDMNDSSKIIYPTINGYLVKSTYLLQIKPIFSGCICCEGSNPPPVIYLPLTLLEVNQQQIYSGPIDQPIDWSPQQFDVYQINDSNYQIDQGNQNMKKMIQPMNID